MKPISRSFLFVMLFLFSKASLAQKPLLEFNLVTGPNGKSLGKIKNITQDPHGYIWFAGEGGKCIYRYDGNRIITYRHDDANPNSLGGTTVNSVYADNSGMIWVGLNEGLDKYNPATGIFKHYRHNPRDPESLGGTPGPTGPVLRDQQGRLWVGTDNGLDRLNEKTGKFIHYRNESGNQKSLSSNIVWCIYEDRQGVIWVGTGFPWFKKDPEDGGLNRLEPDGTFTRFMHDPNNPHSLINNKIAAILEDSHGVFWVGTSGDGLHTMDRKTGTFERHLYNPKTPDQLSRPPLKPGNDNEKITFITEDSTGKIWIGTMGSGINRYNPVTKKITHLEHSYGFPDGTSWNAFTSKEGEVWITTQDNNLYRVDPFYKSVNHLSTGNMPGGFLEDNKGNLWIGTFGNGLLEYDQHKKFIQQFKHNPSDPLSLTRDNQVTYLFQNQPDSIWVGTGLGLRIFNTVTKQFSNFYQTGNLKDTALGVSKILLDKEGIMWFGRWGLGLIRYNPNDHSFKDFFPNPNDTSSFSLKEILEIMEDKSGMLWISGPQGINSLNRKTGRYKHYLSGIWVSSIFEDSGGNLWAGAENGLYRYNQKEDRFTNFFEPYEELYSTTMGRIVEDSEKKLWLNSNVGIIKLNPSTKEIFIYKNQFGINPGSLLTWAGVHKSQKGEIFIPNENGLYYFLPVDMNVKTDFKIIITDFFINTHAVLAGKESPLQKPIEEISDLVLKYNQNNISFNFSAIDYRAPEAIRYFTMLEGYDNTWREVKGEKNSFYFNLSKGKYTYRVKAFNKDGTHAEKIITIQVNPPWWQTWWAYTLYALLVITAVWTFIKWRTNSLKKEKIKLEEKVVERTKELKEEKDIVESTLSELKSTQAQLIQSEKMASLGELTAGIAHEIQNPLNFVNNFSEVSTELIKEMVDEVDKGNTQEVKAIASDLIQNLEKINHHGQRAAAIVKGMLQHSRSSSGVKEPTDINALCDEYLRLSYHGLRAKDKSFNATLKTDFDNSIGKINIIPQDIGRVVLNLINNAFYAVDEKKKLNIPGYEPTVIVSTRLLNPLSGGRGAEIRVTDNGNGIPQKIVDKIFQPFFTTKPTGQGTGLGLSLSYDIINAHGGEIKVETKEVRPDDPVGRGEGTTFIIQLTV